MKYVSAARRLPKRASLQVVVSSSDASTSRLANARLAYAAFGRLPAYGVESELQLEQLGHTLIDTWKHALLQPEAAWDEVTLPHLAPRTGWRCYWSQLLLTVFEEGWLPDAPESGEEVAKLVDSQEWIRASSLCE